MVTNPYVANPDSPVKVADFPKVDVIVVADGHGDEVGSTDEIAIKTGAKVVTPSRWGTSSSSRGRCPLAQAHRSGPGDGLTIDDPQRQFGIRFRHARQALRWSRAWGS